jgi:hypothetical protein
LGWLIFNFEGSNVSKNRKTKTIVKFYEYPENLKNWGSKKYKQLKQELILDTIVLIYDFYRIAVYFESTVL